MKRIAPALAASLVAAAALAQYPAKPIRIVVENGNLTLYGTVATAMDKQIAGMRANQVFGVFSVQNNLAVVKGS